MIKKTRMIGAFVGLVVVYLLLGSLLVRGGRLAQYGIQSSGVDSAPNVASAHRVNGNAMQSALTNNSSDARSPVDDRRKMNRGAAAVGVHSLAMSSKGGGGTVAVVTFLILFGLWCFRGLSTEAKSASAR